MNNSSPPPMHNKTTLAAQKYEEVVAAIVAAVPDIHFSDMQYRKSDGVGHVLIPQYRPITLSDVCCWLMNTGCRFTFNHNFRLAVVDRKDIDHGAEEFDPMAPLSEQSEETLAFLHSLLHD